MAVKVIYVAGVPASGKTTLFKRIRECLFAQYQEFKWGKVRGIQNGAYKMLGVFDGSKFEGTDRLCMDVIGDAIAYVKELQIQDKKSVVLIEGDRLFNFRFLNAVSASIIILDASPEILEERHLLRGDDQSNAFCKGRRTKVDNFAAKYGIARVYNNTPQDTDRILGFIISLATNYIGIKDGDGTTL